MLQPTRLFDLIEYQRDNFPQQRAFVFRNDGKETAYSTQDIIDLAEKISIGLLRAGIQPDDKIASVVVKNRPEWVALDIALLQIGAVHVPVYPTISIFDFTFIFNQAEVKMCFIGDDGTYSLQKKIETAQNDVPTLKNIFTFDMPNDERLTMNDEQPLSSSFIVNPSSFTQLFPNETQLIQEKSRLERIKQNIRPDDLATIIYTSGTTGEPKGVMLSHRNILSNMLSIIPVIPIKAGYRGLSFLPLNHIFERIVTYAYTYVGANVTYVGIDNLGGDKGDLKAVQPHFFTAVPRLLEKVYERIYNRGTELTGLKKGLFFWALHLTDDYDYGIKYRGVKKLKMYIADRLIFSKWREALGGHIKGIVVGASPCPIKILKAFSAAGIPVREGYGLTEMSPGISFNYFEDNAALLGSVGRVVDNVEVFIDTGDGNYTVGEGEILAAGENVMLGYYKNPVETAKIIRYIDGKRWLCTGDIGRLEIKNGVTFLRITDRKKELFKTSNGKYVAPAPIENKLRENFMIDQVMLVGDNRKFVSALIVPAVEALQKWCTENGISWTRLNDIVNNPTVQKKYNDIVEKYNHFFGHTEQIKAFKLVPDSWEPTKTDGSISELTPTMKLKRRVILEKYKNTIEELYKV